MTSPGNRLRVLMDKGCVPVPGAFNGLCARAVARAGFSACYVSGAATSVGAGVPDVGVLTLEHFCRVIREVSDASGLPVLADADTGFGEAEMVRRTVIEYARAGAHMIFPEGLTAESEFQQFAHAMKGGKTGERHPYLLANMTEFGKTPLIPLSKFSALGYACVIYPVSLLRVAMGAVTRALDQLRRDGSVEGFHSQMQTRQDLYALIGYSPGTPWEFPDR